MRPRSYDGAKYPTRKTKGPLRQEEREQILEAIRVEVDIDPRDPVERVRARMYRKHGWAPLHPVVHKLWRETVEGTGNPEPPATTQADAQRIERSARASATPQVRPRSYRTGNDGRIIKPEPPPAASDVVEEPATSPRSDMVEEQAVRQEPREVKAFAVIGPREVVLSKLELVNAYNEGFCDAYLQLLGRGIALPRMVKRDDGTGFTRMGLEDG